MAGERIDSMSEARRLRHAYRSELVATVLPDTQGVHVGQHGVTGTGMDGIEVDFDALRQAERDLAALHDDLVTHLKDADDLTGPLGDGTSPVTGPMRKAFTSRADIEGGVKAALVDYMSELMSVRVAILETLAGYEGSNDAAADLIGRQLTQLEGMA